MGNRSAKKSLPGHEKQRFGSLRRWRRSGRFPRPFPILTPQSYVPGDNTYSTYETPAQTNRYPPLTPNSYLPPTDPTDPPVMNINTHPMPPPLPSMPIRPRTTSSMPVYNPGLPSYSYDQYHQRRSRPVVRILESTSCSSTSTCSTISIAPRRTHRVQKQQQQQQPIILLPYQCSQPTQTGATQLTTLPPIQVNSSSFLPSSATTNPLTINSIPSVFQPSRTTGSGQRLRAGPIRYVQAAPRSSSTTQLHYITAESRSARAPSHVLVNRSRSRTKSVSLLHVPQKDLKFGRRPFDWYANGGTDIVLKDNVRVGRRGLVSLGR